ncbi:MAG TPA: hypothetical protein VFX16_17205 [Pseudonocardiaceae bacterium]|nr:hypothetical protein [Pseudonocardiaceae bacterium]
MRPGVRNVLVLTGCLAVLGTAGGLATAALHSATVASTQVETAAVVVDANDTSGAAKLTVLQPVNVNSGGGRRTVPAGTQFVTASGLLTESLPAASKAVVGDTLSCDLRISVSRGDPVIDLVRCTPAKTSPRG